MLWYSAPIPVKMKLRMLRSIAMNGSFLSASSVSHVRATLPSRDTSVSHVSGIASFIRLWARWGSNSPGSPERVNDSKSPGYRRPRMGMTRSAGLEMCRNETACFSETPSRSGWSGVGRFILTTNLSFPRPFPGRAPLPPLPPPEAPEDLLYFFCKDSMRSYSFSFALARFTFLGTVLYLASWYSSNCVNLSASAFRRAAGTGRRWFLKYPSTSSQSFGRLTDEKTYLMRNGAHCFSPAAHEKRSLLHFLMFRWLRAKTQVLRRNSGSCSAIFCESSRIRSCVIGKKSDCSTSSRSCLFRRNTSSMQNYNFEKKIILRHFFAAKWKKK